MPSLRRKQYQILLSLKKEKQSKIFISLRKTQYQILLLFRKNPLSNIAVTEEKPLQNIATTEKKKHIPITEEKNSLKHCYH